MDSQNTLSQMDETMIYQPETPRLCAKGCGFFGTSATRNLCSKCYTSFLKEESAKSSTKLTCTEKIVSPTVFVSPSNKVNVDSDVSAKKNRCVCCHKKVGPLGFKCRCGGMFCGMHRYPEEHSCSFDYKTTGRIALAKENPFCDADKLQERI